MSVQAINCYMVTDFFLIDILEMLSQNRGVLDVILIT